MVMLMAFTHNYLCDYFIIKYNTYIYTIIIIKEHYVYYRIGVAMVYLLYAFFGMVDTSHVPTYTLGYMEIADQLHYCLVDQLHYCL